MVSETEGAEGAKFVAVGTGDGLPPGEEDVLVALSAQAESQQSVLSMVTHINFIEDLLADTPVCGEYPIFKTKNGRH